MDSDAQLDCPLCGAKFTIDLAAVEASCPSCRASAIGGTNSPLEAAAAVGQALGIGSGQIDDVAATLFSIDPEHPLSDTIAITSDQRDGFYRWWVVIAANADPVALRESLAPR